MNATVAALMDVSQLAAALMQINLMDVAQRERLRETALAAGADLLAALLLPPRVGDAEKIVKSVLADNAPSVEILDRLTHE
jgi:hypothetical protein